MKRTSVEAIGESILIISRIMLMGFVFLGGFPADL